MKQRPDCRQTGTKARVLAHLTGRGKERSADVAAALGIAKSAVQSAIYALHKEGFVTSHGHANRRRWSVRPPASYSEAAQARFWAKVDVRGPEDCWPWLGGKRTGYGAFRSDCAQRSAHRVSYELAYGPIPHMRGYHGACVMHACDNKACVNPVHLRLGTNSENMRDMVAKGRQARGERNGFAKLAPELVPAIRAYLAAGASQAHVGRLFGISQTHAGCIGRRVRWSHVQ